MTVWPRTAQWATVILVGLATVLIGFQSFTSWGGSSRPTELQQSAGLTYRIDLNQAEHAELLQLPGVGEHLAQRIENHRHEHGGFHNVDELTLVPGIGPATVERLRPWVCVRAAEKEPGPEAPPAHASTVLAMEKGADKKKAEDKGSAVHKTAKLTELININTASAEELQKLPGVGPKLSQRIIAERDKKPFKSVDELRRVSGIGVKTLEHLRPFITVGTDASRVTRAD
jgi:competence protein ComEA